MRLFDFAEVRREEEDVCAAAHLRHHEADGGDRGVQVLGVGGDDVDHHPEGGDAQEELCDSHESQDEDAGSFPLLFLACVLRGAASHTGSVLDCGVDAHKFHEVLLTMQGSG